MAVGGDVVAGAGVALALGFLAYHRVELARAVTAVPALAAFVSHRGVPRAEVAAGSAAAIVVAALIVLAWYGAGAVFLHRRTADLVPTSLDTLATARTVAHGAGLWSLAWFGLGLAGLYTTAAAAVALILGVALAAVALRRRWRSRVPRERRTADRRAWPVALSTGIALVLGIALMAALAPPTAKDALQYHIAVPKAFVAAARLVEVPGNIAAYFPLGAEMHGLWAMLLGRGLDPRLGEAAFGVTLYVFLPLLLAIVYGWARRLDVPRRWALAAAAIVATPPTVYEVAASGYADLALAVYVALAIEATAGWWVTREPRRLADLALAMGFALAVKLIALFVLLVVALTLLLRVFLDARAGAGVRSARGVLVAIAAAVALGLPWYVRTWAATGSPLFPFFLDLWPAQADGWDAERSALLVAFNAQYGPADPLLALLSPILAGLTGWRETPALYEGVLGPAFLVGLAVLTWALYRRRLGIEATVAAALGAGLVVWWALSAQVLRYLLPALAPLAVAIAVAAVLLERAGARRLLLAVAAPAASALVVTLAWFAADAPMLATLGAESRDAYLARRLDYYPYYRLVNQTLDANARVWLIDMRRDTYHLERSYVADYLFEDHTLRRWVVAAAEPAVLTARARALGITHVLVRHDVLLDYERSALVDDTRPRAENVARLEAVRSFLTSGTTILRADRKFLLAALPAAR